LAKIFIMQAQSLPQLFFQKVHERKNNVAFEYRIRRNEPYRTVSWNRLSHIVSEIAYGLIELGLEKGGTVVILSDTRYEWAACDFAVLSCGGVVVPIYPSLPDEGVNYILNNSEAIIAIVENKGQLQKIRGQWDKLPYVKYAIVIDDFGDLPTDDPRILSLQRLRYKGKRNIKRDPIFLRHYIDSVSINDLATVIYTSGTTGNPKGVMLTHKNILSVLNVLPELLPVSEAYKFLSFLPLSHVFERVVGLHFPISVGATITYCSNIDQIATSMKDSGAMVMMVVPRILEKIYAKLEGELNKANGFKKKMLDWAFLVSGKFVDAKNSKEYFSFDFILNYIQYLVANLLVMSQIRRKLAPMMYCFVSGGAPLSIDIARYFHMLGYVVLQGYGLTETTAPATTNTIKDNKLGTVGKPLPGTEIKIAEDGEILVKGFNVFSGYYKNEEKNKEAFQEKWFCTGDIGQIDSDGFLQITDRKKDIIVNSAGKNVAPQNIENAVRMSPYISNVIVIGDKRKYLSALVTLEQAKILEYAKANTLSSLDINDLAGDPAIINLISEEVKYRTAPFADYEQIRRFTLLPNDFTIDSGEITPTLKVKRKFVEEKYKDIIEKMYPVETKIAR